MGKLSRELVAPAYLLLCLILGGSAQGVWGNMVLELAGIGILAWAAAAATPEPLPRAARQLLLLVLALLGVVLLQLLPLPASVWPSLGGRGDIADGYGVLGMTVPSRPLSLSPYAGVATLVELIPPLALFCAIVSLRAYRPAWLAVALATGTVGAITLGTLQVTSADPATSPWYLYDDSSAGVATGFFANANHMAMLLIVTIPFLSALLTSSRRADRQRHSAAIAFCGGILLLLIVGLVLNRSIAGYLLVVPVAGASALLLVPMRSRGGRVVALLAAALMLVGITVLASTPVGDKTLGTSASVSSRTTIARTTVEAVTDFMPFGSGLGSFRPVYRLYEDHDRIDRTTVNHAHNEYLEVALELGVPGIVLMALFLAWWARAALATWRGGGSDAAFARAGSIASAALLLHSLVEFPLRSIALGALFGMCVALMIARRQSAEADKSELWPTRHLVVG